MFTGIIERVGTVVDASRGPDGLLLTVDVGTVELDVEPGDSVAVNGACLTVERTDGGRFTATAVPETLRRTTLGRVRVGDGVNLERAVAAGGRFGGHFVQGHVDGLETILHRAAGGEGVIVAVSLSRDLAAFVAPKGSIAVDGLSLTVVDVSAGRFSVTLVPYTIQNTALGSKVVGEQVNVEVDVLAKYVWRMLQEMGPERQQLDEAFLAEHGFAG